MVFEEEGTEMSEQLHCSTCQNMKLNAAHSREGRVLYFFWVLLFGNVLAIKRARYYTKYISGLDIVIEKVSGRGGGPRYKGHRREILAPKRRIGFS